MNIKEKLKNKINLSIILFFIIFLNYLPLIIPNSISKESFGVGNLQMVMCFMIEIIILIIYFINQFIKNGKKLNINKEIKINFVLLILTTIILLGVQIYNFFSNEFKFMDILNIGCVFINILVLYICMMNIKIEENSIYTFLKSMIYFVLVSCIVSYILYYKEIFDMIVNGKYRPDVTIKSFFANRNQFAFFLYIGIIADVFVIKYDKKLIYKLILPVFLFSLVTTASRTGMALGVFFIGLVLLFCDKIKLKTKILIGLSGLILMLIGIVAIYNYMPDTWNKLNKTLIRIHEVKNFSGRTDIWDRGINILKENPRNFLLGVGRFKAIESLENVGGKSFTQFHNIYIDTLVTGGMMELLYFGFIYFTVIRKIVISKLDKKYKSIYIAMFVSYAIYIALESFGRFSIGCSDTICFIFFITIPLLHTNFYNIENKEKRGEK